MTLLPSIRYDNLPKTVETLYRENPQGLFYFDFDNVLFNKRACLQNFRMQEAVCAIPLAQRRILTARVLPASLRECLAITTQLGYDFTEEELLSAGAQKGRVLSDEAKSRSECCPWCGNRPVFFFDDSLLNILDAKEYEIPNLSSYWVDHFHSHEREWNELRSEAEFPFLSHDGGIRMVFQQIWHYFLSAAEQSRRRAFYYASRL